MNSEKDMLHFLNFGSKVGGQMVPKLEIEASQRGSEEMEPACYPKRKGPCRQREGEQVEMELRGTGKLSIDRGQRTDSRRALQREKWGCQREPRR